METLPNEWFSLLLVFALGMRHGLDADHLATIDGLTRFNVGRGFASWCGCLFSLGHGAVVTAVAVGSGALASRWMAPVWMEDFGVWISIIFLTALGVLNLRAVMICKQDQLVLPVGLKGRFFKRLRFTQNPWLIMLVGALFALSFDTLSLAALFSAAPHERGYGGEAAFGLGMAFTLGMLLTDGLNGLWISRLMGRTDQWALVASRVMGFTVGMLSLLVAGWGFARYISPAVQAWGNGKEVAIGCSIFAIITMSFLCAGWRARMRETCTEAG